MCDEKLTVKNVAIRDATDTKLATPVLANANPPVRHDQKNYLR
jgi:hypothetical protein